MRFGTRVVVGLTAAVMALAGAEAVSAGTLPAGLYSPQRPPAPPNNTLHVGLYPAKPPAPGKEVPLPAGVGSSNTAALACYPVEGFKSVANDRYVAAELDYGIRYPRQNGYAMLRARATAVGPWEKFQFCRNKANNLWSIFSDANGKWAVTEIGYPGPDKDMLRAHAGSIGPWEEYSMACIIGGHGSFVFYSYANKRYVAAELGGGAYTGKDYAMLRARSGTTGEWEIFRPDPGCPS